jgi:hypothetical protein
MEDVGAGGTVREPVPICRIHNSFLTVHGVDPVLGIRSTARSDCREDTLDMGLCQPELRQGAGTLPVCTADCCLPHCSIPFLFYPVFVHLFALSRQASYRLPFAIDRPIDMIHSKLLRLTASTQPASHGTRLPGPYTAPPPAGLLLTGFQALRTGSECWRPALPDQIAIAHRQQASACAGPLKSSIPAAHLLDCLRCSPMGRQELAQWPYCC